MTLLVGRLHCQPTATPWLRQVISKTAVLLASTVIRVTTLWSIPERSTSIERACGFRAQWIDVTALDAKPHTASPPFRLYRVGSSVRGRGCGFCRAPRVTFLATEKTKQRPLLSPGFYSAGRVLSLSQFVFIPGCLFLAAPPRLVERSPAQARLRQASLDRLSPNGAWYFIGPSQQSATPTQKSVCRKQQQCLLNRPLNWLMAELLLNK